MGTQTASRNGINTLIMGTQTGTTYNYSYSSSVDLITLKR